MGYVIGHVSSTAGSKCIICGKRTSTYLSVSQYSKDAKNKLMQFCNTQEQIFIPFSSQNFFMGKNQYTVDSIISHPEFIFTSHF